MLETKKVLIIDDSGPTRDITADMLRMMGLQVLTAKDGRSGVDTYRTDPADLVLLDMNMPEMDGVSTYEALCEINPEVNVIVCTSDSIGKVAMRFGPTPAPPYLHKPFDTGNFMQMVESALT